MPGLRPDPAGSGFNTEGVAHDTRFLQTRISPPTQPSPATPYTARQVNCTARGMGSKVARKPMTQNSTMAARSRLRLT